MQNLQYKLVRQFQRSSLTHMSSKFYCPSPSSLLHFQQTTKFVPDLTGKVFKTEFYSFAYGGHGDVWKGKWMHEGSGNPLMVAVKVIKGINDPTKSKIFLRESCVWSTLSHPNITPLLGVVFDFDQLQTPCLVSPYYMNGHIQKYIENHPGVNKLALISQIASGLEYMHARSVIHGDIKPSHILVNDEGEAKITDFGLSRLLDTTGFTSVSSGTRRYVPAELLKICEEEEFNPSMARGWRGKAPERMTVSPNEADECIPRVTKATDVWEFSMTALEILTGTIPFSHIKRDASVIHFVVSGGRPKRVQCNLISNEIWKMLEQCWRTDPIQRPSMTTLSTFVAEQAVGRARL